ncbi:50S rRNA methyltransferase [SAR11 cluster bacterium PRT-SC02]|jgi:23S rRNA (uridine2552-2'-O)-methyltransferase|nr:50S rRNA methyltransferase [SAR11 cluster bacterium PRT-SC02]
MKKNKSSKNWIINQHRDEYFKQSRSLGYRSRAAFKLLELNKKFNFLKKNSKVLDLGAAPGGWSQVASNYCTKGKVMSVDLKQMTELKNVKFLMMDFRVNESKKAIENFFGDKISIILSDMAANTTGNKDLDCIRTNELCMEALKFSLNVLDNNGVIISKLFNGQDFEVVKKFALSNFKKVRFFKPKSSKDHSKETYIHCCGLKTL